MRISRLLIAAIVISQLLLTSAAFAEEASPARATPPAPPARPTRAGDEYLGVRPMTDREMEQVEGGVLSPEECRRRGLDDDLSQQLWLSGWIQTSQLMGQSRASWPLRHPGLGR